MDTVIDSSGRDIADADSGDLIGAARVKGTAVYDSSGERIGTIDEVVISKREGTIAYALMSFGGFLGIGEKYHPLPWDVLTYDTSLGGYQVGTAGENFREAPSYSRNEIDSGDWGSATDDYYSESGSWLTRRDSALGAGVADGRRDI
jgi:sporulation protein YlmC with PRC-barrel domain